MLIGGRFATFLINWGCDDLLHSALIWERCVASLSCVALRCVALLCAGRIGDRIVELVEGLPPRSRPRRPRGRSGQRAIRRPSQRPSTERGTNGFCAGGPVAPPLPPLSLPLPRGQRAGKNPSCRIPLPPSLPFPRFTLRCFCVGFGCVALRCVVLRCCER